MYRAAALFAWRDSGFLSRSQTVINEKLREDAFVG